MSINSFCGICQDARIKDLMDDDQRAAHDAKERRVRILAEVEAAEVDPSLNDYELVVKVEITAEQAHSDYDGPRSSSKCRERLTATMAYALAAIEAIDKECGR